MVLSAQMCRGRQKVRDGAILENQQYLLRRRQPGEPPVIIGHRGARGEMPENTISGLDHGYSLGVRMFEIDVQTDKNHLPIVWHDPHLFGDKVRDPSGQWLAAQDAPVSSLSAAQLGTLGVGMLRSDGPTKMRFPAQRPCDDARISTLAELCKWVAERPDVFINVEIKSFQHIYGFGDTPDILAQQIMGTLENAGVLDRIMVSSFDWRVLDEIKRQNFAVKIGFLTQVSEDEEGSFEQNIYADSIWMNGAKAPDDLHRLPHIIAAQGGHAWAPYFEELTAEDVAIAHELGLLVYVWTVNEPADMLAASDKGVDGIITDYPARALAVFGMAADVAPAVPNQEAL